MNRFDGADGILSDHGRLRVEVEDPRFVLRINTDADADHDNNHRDYTHCD